MLATLTGASAAGKTTIESGLRRRLGNIKPVISYTTRPSRESDLPGNYAHVSGDEFKRMIVAREFIWWVSLFGNCYGTTMKSLEDTSLDPGSVFLMVLEPDSVRTLRLFAERMKIRVASFYIVSPPPEMLRIRLEKRGDKPEEIERRIRECSKWDEDALKSGIPYVFIRNDSAVEVAMTLIAVEIVHRMSA